MPDTPLLPSDDDVNVVRLRSVVVSLSAVGVSLHRPPSLVHWIEDCEVLPTIEEVPTIEVPLVQLPKMSRTPWASFASPSPTTIPSSETPTSTVRASPRYYDEPTPETLAEMRRLEALWLPSVQDVLTPSKTPASRLQKSARGASRRAPPG